MNIINTVMYAVSYALMRPFKHTSPWFALIWVSAVMAFSALLVFKYFSSQDRLAEAKQVVFARVLEFRLFRHDVWSVFGIFMRVLVATGGYLRYSLKPFLLLFVPLVLLLIQLAGWFEWRPLLPGESVLVYAQAVAQEPPDGTLTTSSELTVETPGFVMTENAQTFWRIKAVDLAETAWVAIDCGGQSIRKSLMITENLVQVSPKRVLGFWTSLEHPGESVLPPSSGLSEIVVDYPRRNFRIGRWHVHWMVALFLISMIFGLVLKYPMRVDF